jgi:hypothetical protein
LFSVRLLRLVCLVGRLKLLLPGQLTVHLGVGQGDRTDAAFSVSVRPAEILSRRPGDWFVSGLCWGLRRLGEVGTVFDWVYGRQVLCQLGFIVARGLLRRLGFRVASEGLVLCPVHLSSLTLGLSSPVSNLSSSLFWIGPSFSSGSTSHSFSHYESTSCKSRLAVS